MDKWWRPQAGWRVWARRVVSASVLLLASCGGGADSPNGGAGESQASGGVGSGGTGSYSNGPITAFGSIVVNGVHYDHTSAVSIKKTGDDVTLHSAADLQLGMMVEVDVTPVADGGKLNIRYGSDLLGPVDSIDLTAQTLTVMGQVVSTFYVSDTNKTQFGTGLSSLADLAAGDVVEVYGFEDAGTGQYIATRIERRVAYSSGPYVVRGAIQNLEKDSDGTVTGCTIGGQHIAYTWSSTSRPLVEGLVARAELMRVHADSSEPWLAAKMVLSEPFTSADRGVALIDGLVTRIEPGSTTRFSVNGVDVDASLADCPACSALTVGQRVSIKGARVNGVIVASEIR